MFERRRSIFCLLMVVVFLFVQGCVHRYSDIFVHDPPLVQNVTKLVRGKTTGTEILSLFGTPDFEADGAEDTVNTDSTMGEQRAAMKSKCEDYNRLIEKNKYVANLPKCDPGCYEESARLLAYSSIDEDHIAYLYVETSWRRRNATYFVPVGVPGAYSKSTNDVRINRLFILVNKHTGLVDNFAFREEFKADD